MKEDLVIIARLSERDDDSPISLNTTYIYGHISKETLVGTEFEGEQIIYTTGWSHEPLTLIKTDSIRPAAIIHVQENEGK